MRLCVRGRLTQCLAQNWARRALYTMCLMTLNAAVDTYTDILTILASWGIRQRTLPVQARQRSQH